MGAGSSIGIGRPGKSNRWADASWLPRMTSVATTAATMATGLRVARVASFAGGVLI